MATIFNKNNGKSFFINNITIDVGKAVPGKGDTDFRVGDKVYMKLAFEARDFKLTGGGSDTPPKPEDVLAYFAPFFTFRFDIDDREFSVKLVKGEIVSVPEGPQLYTLNYFVDFSDLDSGEKIINLWAFTKIDEEEVIYSTDPFYLHQSILNQFQKNIANEGIDDTRTGLDREKVNFPSYLPVGLQPVNPFVTRDVALWSVIRDGTNALSFRSYSAFMDYIFCGGRNPFISATEKEAYRAEVEIVDRHLALPFNNVDAYRALKVATEAFVMATVLVSSALNEPLLSEYDEYLKDVSTGVASPESIKILPYLALVRQKLPDIVIKFTTHEEALKAFIDKSRILETCTGLIHSKLRYPCFLELIWSYWHEESMMVQGINTIARRFQNIRGEGIPDPLANMEIGPLRPLNNLMWGYIQDEQHRLTVRRRAYEYDHHYGITLQGTAVKGMRPADSRSKFLEAFHTLLNLTQKFYRQYDDTTIVADAFPIMNALKEVHMILSEGAHNQFGDLPSTARIEMLMQQYILARPEFREFLPTRQMVAYPEAWMDRVGVLNQMHGWTNTNVLHFRDLAVFGEQIVLSIRFGAWSDVFNRDQAANWAIFWRPQIQNYIHAYRAVTGVDLAREDGVVDALEPSFHLLRRLREQNIRVRI